MKRSHTVVRFLKMSVTFDVSKSLKIHLGLTTALTSCVGRPIPPTQSAVAKGFLSYRKKEREKE